MNSKTIFKKAYAKINLCLDVLGTRGDGYHSVDMIMQQIDLHDDVIIEAGEVSCGANEYSIDLNVTGLQSSLIPTDERNLMYRAARLMAEKYNIHSYLRMTLIKRIPSEAGLGGGSADAAAVFTGMNELFKLNASLDGLMALGAGLGADIPFCIMGETARAEGVGTDMTRLNNLAALHRKTEPGLIPGYVLLIKPAISASTPRIYADYDRAALNNGRLIRHPDVSFLSEAISSSEPLTVRQALIDNNINVLEHALMADAPSVAYKKLQSKDLITAIKERLLFLGAVTASMTGSGSVVYGLFDSEEKMLSAKEMFADATLTPFIKAIYAARFSDAC